MTNDSDILHINRNFHIYRHNEGIHHFSSAYSAISSAEPFSQRQIGLDGNFEKREKSFVFMLSQA